MGFLEGFEYSQLHVMVVPFPAQGHINPMLQFAKRLASKNVGVTFVTTEANHKRMLQAHGATSGASKKPGEVRFETIPDGLTSDSERSDLVVLSEMLYNIGGVKLGNLIERLNAQGTQISCIVQDSFMGWVPEVAKKFKIPSAFFWTQSCAAYSIYHHFVHGKLGILLYFTLQKFHRSLYFFIVVSLLLILTLCSSCFQLSSWKKRKIQRLGSKYQDFHR